MPADTAPRPPRVYLMSIAAGINVNAQYNPESLEEELGAVYQKIKIQGLSHQPLQYEHTENWHCSFDLAFDGLSSETYDINQARNWLSSLLYPTRGATNIASGAPPRVAFVWPGLISLTSVITKLKFKHKRFAWTGVDMATTWFICSVTLEEIRDTRLYNDDVAHNGTLRAST